MTEPQINKDSWIRRNPRKTMLIFLGLVLMMILSITELSLRWMGHKPGVLEDNPYLIESDSFYVKDEYVADEYSIMKYSASNIARINSFVADTHSLHYIDSVETQTDLEFTTLAPMIDFYLLHYQHDTINTSFSFYQWDEPFYQYVQQIRQKDSSEWSDQERLIRAYSQQPINQEGFRSIPFQNHSTDSVKVLLLGDSFTWGASAKPIVNSFADLLLLKGYYVYNSGIVGADPLQYQAIAKRYLEQIQPDIVVVNYFMGNDHVYFQREVKPHEFVYHVTSAGWVYSYPKGFYLPPQDAYDYVRQRLELPQQNRKWANWFCAKSVIGTKAWIIARALGMVEYRPEVMMKYVEQDTLHYHKPPISQDYLQEIQALCEANDVKCMFSMIPRVSDVSEGKDVQKELQSIFPDLPYILKDSLLPEDYNPDPDGHFNNQGAAKYADFLDREIQRVLKE